MNRLFSINRIDLLAVAALVLIIAAAAFALIYAFTEDGAAESARSEPAVPIDEQEIDRSANYAEPEPSSGAETAAQGLTYKAARFFKDRSAAYGERVFSLRELVEDVPGYVASRLGGLIGRMRNAFAAAASGISSSVSKAAAVDIGAVAERYVPRPASVMSSLKGGPSAETAAVKEDPDALFSTRSKEFSVDTRTEALAEAGSAESGSWWRKAAEKLAALGNFITRGAASVNTAIAGIFGSDKDDAGMTLYDRKTGEPYCVEVVNGAMTTRYGKCAKEPVDKTADFRGDASSSPVLD